MTIGLNIGHVFGWAVLAAAVALASSPGAAPAADHFSPPMGWNSYTGYSIAVTEAELLKNIDFLSEKLLRYGYGRCSAQPTGERGTRAVKATVLAPSEAAISNAFRTVDLTSSGDEP